MDMQELKDIIRLLKQEGLTEITVSDGDQRVTVKRLLQGAPIQQAQQAPIDEAIAQPTPPELPDREFQLTAPLVGTFYRRPSPDDEPFVATGGTVQAGDTVCIIEAMKVMNEIKAETSGTIVEICCKDGEAIEYGQVLFKVRP